MHWSGCIHVDSTCNSILPSKMKPIDDPKSDPNDLLWIDMQSALGPFLKMLFHPWSMLILI